MDTVSQQSAVIDRTVVSIISPTPEKTPSSKNAVNTDTELLHRLHGTSLISSACCMLQMNPSSFATACCIFHRFYHRESLVKCDVWSVSMACILLAGKVEDDPCPIRKIILCFVHLYRRRRLQSMDDTATDDDHSIHSSEERMNSSNEEIEMDDNESVLKKFPPMSPLGRVYKEWKEVLIQMESVILRTLGFVLYWIPDNNHPHKFILYFVRVVVPSSADKEKEHALAQTAWNYCNDSCFLDICVRFKPEVTACAAIYLSARENNITLPQNPRPWWEIFIGSNQEQGMSNVCNALVALQNEAIVNDAFQKFIPSLLPNESSFNDPGSFVSLWMDEFEFYCDKDN